MEVEEGLKELVEELQKDGLKVYVREAKERPTYIHFTNGKDIGYAELTYLGAIKFTTVHKPNSETGTGFGLDVGASYKDAFKTPNWAWEYKIKKFKDWEEFHNYDSWNKKLTLYKG